jgi:hypothetical protein
VAPGTVTLPLCSRRNASPFWIMLLLSLDGLEHGMIPGVVRPSRAAASRRQQTQMVEHIGARGRSARFWQASSVSRQLHCLPGPVFPLFDDLVGTHEHGWRHVEAFAVLK